jgi:hypothetical protein
VVATGSDEQEVMMSRLADKKIWGQRGERFNVIAMDGGEQEVMSLRLVDGEI